MNNKNNILKEEFFQPAANSHEDNVKHLRNLSISANRNPCNITYLSNLLSSHHSAGIPVNKNDEWYKYLCKNAPDVVKHTNELYNVDQPKHYRTMNFPNEELSSLEVRLKNNMEIYTTRVSYEYKKWNDIGEQIKTNINGDILEITGISILKNIDGHPFYNQLTPSQIRILKKHRHIKLLKLTKVSENLNESYGDIRDYVDNDLLDDEFKDFVNKMNNRPKGVNVALSEYYNNISTPIIYDLHFEFVIYLKHRDYNKFIKNISIIISNSREVLLTDEKVNKDYIDIMTYYKNDIIQSLNGQQIQEFINIVSINNQIELSIISESQFKKTDLIPVYVLLTHSGSLMSNLIKNFTSDPYSHSSISFDGGLQNLYSFARPRNGTDNSLNGSFIMEDIKRGIWIKNNSSYSLYVTFVNINQLTLMQNKLEQFKQSTLQFKYNFGGLINFVRGKETHRQDSLFCSEFVDTILKAGKQFFDKDSSLIKPYDFAKHKEFHFVCKGKMKNYNPIKVNEKTNEIIQDIVDTYNKNI